MKFRYFILQGESRKAFLKSEREEMDQRIAQRKALLEDRNDIESFRSGHDGKIFCITFKDGKQPDGFVRASKKLPPKEVRPHGKSKEAKPWRELLASLDVTEDCQAVICKLLDLPEYVPGAHSGSRSGMGLFSSRIGHVGKKVFVEVPVSAERAFEPHKDLKEVEGWRYEKAVAEAEDFEYTKRVYVMGSRAQS